MSEAIVLAFSGGLDTSFCVPWLAETYGRPVVTVTVDTGGLDAAAAAALRERSRRLGAVAHRLVDGREAFFERVLRFLIMGNVRRGQLYPICVGAERGTQAQLVAEAARQLGSRTVAHGCTAAGNDQVRFEVALRTLAPELEVLAPVRDQPRPRAEQVAYLEARALPVPSFGAAYSVNRGLWGVTIGGRETLDSVESIPDSAWVLTRGAFDPSARPLPPRPLRIGFERGVPVALDGEALAPVELVERLEEAARVYGIGRGIHLGETILGIKGRVAFEAPAAEVLLTAHRELEKLTLTGRQQRVKEMVAAVYGDLVHEGQHLEPVCRDIEALLLSSQARVSGEVRLLLRQGQAFVEGVSSPASLLAASRGVYGEAAGEWTAADARGFSRLAALPSMLWARLGAAGPLDAAAPLGAAGPLDAAAPAARTAGPPPASPAVGPQPGARGAGPEATTAAASGEEPVAKGAL
jgi:argininosuccinate synthase